PYVALVLMAAWGAADRQLGRPLRIALVVSPVVAVIMSWGVHVVANALGILAAVTDRSDAADITSFRSEIWAQSLQLVKAQPWLGVGWGDFNLAWTLTPFGARSAGLVDNAHNLVLQLAVELGVPLALLMTGLLLAALVLAARRTWRLAGDAGLGARAALMIVVVIGVHSMLEYPLWYAYLLLPTAWAFGFAIGAGKAAGSPAGAAPAAPLRAWRWVGALLVVIAPSAWLDYLNIVKLFLPDFTSLPLEQRIARAQASPLYANQADYVAVTNLPLTPDTAPLVARSSHVLLNGRLMFLWANLLQAQGQADKARFMAARLREFNLSGPRPWFAPCDDAAVTAKPFQCLQPEHPVTWRDFR
ncbi:MAG TPA: Wzy polymerase domain-containing protein, partial [Burkholderiaceae bacterium]